MEINGIINIPTKTLERFFRLWLDFTKPLHKLTEKEIKVTACILKYRHELSQKISDPVLLNEILLNVDSRTKIREECDVSLQYFQVMLGELRKKKVIVNNTINPKFIPNFNVEEKKFKLLLHFDWEDEQ